MMKNIKLKNQLRFWVYFIFIILLAGCFLTCFCIAKQGEPNSLSISPDPNTDISNKSLPKVENSIETTKNSATTMIPRYELSEITSFYECVITILSIIIFIILGLNFVYINKSSKDQAAEMAIDALNTKPFTIVLQSIVAKEIDEFAQDLAPESDFIQIHSEMSELQTRVEFLEKQVNIEGYELFDENSDEVKNGNN